MTIDDFKFHAKKQAADSVFYLEEETGGVPLLKFYNLDETGMVDHGFTTRAGGVSKGMFAALNLSDTRGDDMDAVKENFRRTAVSLHADLSDFVLTDQTHTTCIRTVTAEDRGKGMIKDRGYHDIDGLITNEPGIVLAAFFADCVPLYVIDPVRCAIGLCHSGWRGTAARMGQAVIKAMADTYQSKPHDLICAIGPSICQACYQVSEDVAHQFLEIFPNADGELLKPSAPGKYQLDLWKANEWIFLQAGVLPNHIAVTDLCTCCNAPLLFSHRASHGKRGNMGAFLKIKP